MRLHDLHTAMSAVFEVIQSVFKDITVTDTMSTYIERKKPFDKDSEITPCLGHHKIFYSTPSCSGISISEARFRILKKSKQLFIFRCPKYKKKSGSVIDLLNSPEGIKNSD